MSNQHVLRWIVDEVDAGREVSAALTAERWGLAVEQAEKLLGGDWLQYRRLECGHEALALSPDGTHCLTCQHERHLAEFPPEMSDDEVADQGERVWAQLVGASPRPRCERCGGLLAVEYDELGVETKSCLACGPQYGRRPPSEAERQETMPSPRGEHSRRRAPYHAGNRL
jgi:hypothetical protein